MRRVPIPAPVPPPSEWVIWKPIHHVTADQYFSIERFNEAFITLEAVAALSLLTHDIEDGVDELSTLGVI